MKLVAVYPILYGARQYEVGDELPDSEMKQTWLDAGTATLVEDEPEAPAPRAQMLTAQPGQIGISNSGNEDDLAGRIPKSIERATDPVNASDVHDTFMNADEFSDMHDLNGKMMPVQVDSNEQIEREKRFNQHMDGIYKNQKLIYVAATDYGPMPKQGSLIQFDKRPYKVADAISEDGIYSITLEANRA